MVRRKKKKYPSLPTIQLADKLLDEIEEVVSTRHPEYESALISDLEKAFKLVSEARNILWHVDY